MKKKREERRKKKRKILKETEIERQGDNIEQKDSSRAKGRKSYKIF